MDAVRFDTTVDEALAQAAPALRPLMGKHVEVIALDLGRAAQAPELRRKITFDEFLALRVERPKGSPPVTLADMEEAIRIGAVDGNT